MHPLLEKLYNKGTKGVRHQSEACFRTAKSGFFKSADYKPHEIRENTKAKRPHCKHIGMTTNFAEVTKILRIINIHVNSKKRVCFKPECRLSADPQTVLKHMHLL